MGFDMVGSLLRDIHNIAKGMPDVSIMEVCGGHTNVIMRYGIRSLLPKNIKLISGPGCPVCVTSQKDIDSVVALALSGVPIATYGDMFRVPGSNMSLEDVKVNGTKIFEVLSTTDVLDLAKEHKDIVFFGIGFETTVPMTAYLLEKNICVYSTHKLMIPPMKALLKDEIKIDGFIDPGHVSTIIGYNVWDELNVPQAISGFSPKQIFESVYEILKMIKSGQKSVVNCYDSVVTCDGNIKANDLINKTMKVSDAEWRGIGVIPNSGLEPKDDECNAKIKYQEILKNVKSEKDNSACRCSEILKGLIEPKDCKLFGNVCTSSAPKGACMVSDEGTCSIAYRYS
ncbi:MAG: hydrogenase formation protein HypD [DPANN group archaeon]|nr:hydrogenase formation protein HypD [DPANN group archaeon]